MTSCFHLSFTTCQAEHRILEFPYPSLQSSHSNLKRRGGEKKRKKEKQVNEIEAQWFDPAGG